MNIFDAIIDECVKAEKEFQQAQKDKAIEKAIIEGKIPFGMDLKK